MTRRKVLLIALTLVVLVGGILGGIQIVRAIQGGNADTEMTKSVARITYNGAELCTGSVVGDGWVLTARHCFPPAALASNPNSWKYLRVQLWQAGVKNIDTPDYSTSLSGPPDYEPGGNDPTSGPRYRDVMLLHLDTSLPWERIPSWVKTIPTAPNWPALDSKTRTTRFTEYGYGRTSADGSPSDSLMKSQQGSIQQVACPIPWNSGFFCTDNSNSPSWPGDSGGPLLWWVNGYWQQVGSFSDFPKDTKQTWRIFWSEADIFTRNWILSTVGANFPAGTILRDPESHMSWLYESDGYRHWIPDGGTYNCLLSNSELKVAYVNLSLRTIEALPDMANMRDQWATCTPKPAPTSPPAPTVTLTTTTHTPPTVTPNNNHPEPTVTPHSTTSTAPYETAGPTGGNTFTNPANAGAPLGQHVAAYQTIKMSCRLTGWKAPDGNNWWYKIASSPWNNTFYAPADNFYNNGATSGSLHGTPFVDINVPNC